MSCHVSSDMTFSILYQWKIENDPDVRIMLAIRRTYWLSVSVLSYLGQFRIILHQLCHYADSSLLNWVSCSVHKVMDYERTMMTYLATHAKVLTALGSAITTSLFSFIATFFHSTDGFLNPQEMCVVCDTTSLQHYHCIITMIQLWHQRHSSPSRWCSDVAAGYSCSILLNWLGTRDLYFFFKIRCWHSFTVEMDSWIHKKCVLFVT